MYRVTPRYTKSELARKVQKNRRIDVWKFTEQNAQSSANGYEPDGLGIWGGLRPGKTKTPCGNRGFS